MTSTAPTTFSIVLFDSDKEFLQQSQGRRNRKGYHIRVLSCYPGYVREAVEKACEKLAEEFQCLRYVKIHCEVT